MIIQFMAEELNSRTMKWIVNLSVSCSSLSYKDIFI